MANNRKYKTDPELLLAQGKAIVAAGEEARYLHKVEMVNLVLAGLTPSFLAKYCRDSKNAITGWVKLADECGFEALRDGKSTGRPPKLSAEQVAELDKLLGEEPLEYGYRVWDGPSVSDLIKKRYGIAYSVRSCQDMFKRLGYSRADPQVLVVSQDEAHFTQRSTVTAQLVKRGSRPRVASYPGRAKVSFSGFVELGADNGRLFIDSPERFTWETTIASIRGYLATLDSTDKRRIWMILDNAPWHRKAKRLIREQEEYQDIRERVSFLDIPPYSPDLNPIEQVWRVARREVTHNRFFSSIDNEKRELEAWFAELATPNQKLARLCTFQFKLETTDHS